MKPVFCIIFSNGLHDCRVQSLVNYVKYIYGGKKKDKIKNNTVGKEMITLVGSCIKNGYDKDIEMGIWIKIERKHKSVIIQKDGSAGY